MSVEIMNLVEDFSLVIEVIWICICIFQSPSWLTECAWEEVLQREIDRERQCLINWKLSLILFASEAHHWRWKEKKRKSICCMEISSHMASLLHTLWYSFPIIVRVFGGKEPFSIYRYILDFLISTLNERVLGVGVRKELVQWLGAMVLC